MTKTIKVNPISEYKTILREYINKRPSGLRGKIALVLGTHKSFISQITNPSDSTAIPIRHVEAIMDACHLTEEERQNFLAAYNTAHPDTSIDANSKLEENYKTLHIRVPVLEDEKKQEAAELLVKDTVRRIFNLLNEGE